MEIRPLYDRVVVTRVDQRTQTKSGLFLPEKAKERPSEGVVTSVGQGRLRDDGEIEALVLNVGDKVAFGKYAGTEIKLDGVEYVVLREDEVLGVIED